jgi:hypothetical protein
MNTPTEQPLRPKQDSRPQRYGWAPGKYLNHCHACPDTFIGDKRATICADCAYALPEPTEKPAEQASVDLDWEGLRKLYAKAPGPWPDPDTDEDMEISDVDMEAAKRLIYALHNAFPAIDHAIITARQRIGELEALFMEEKQDQKKFLDKLEPKVDALNTTITSQSVEIEKARGIIEGFFASCTPHPVEHPTMYAAWAAAGDFLNTPPPQGEEVRKDGWLPIETAPKGQKVIAGYRNQLGKWRSVMGTYYPPNTLPTTDDWIADAEYAPEGWYEESETHEDIYPMDCPPTHWQPLPASPSTSEAEAPPTQP